MCPAARTPDGNDRENALSHGRAGASALAPGGHIRASAPSVLTAAHAARDMAARVGNRYYSSLPEGWQGRYLAARALGKTIHESASIAEVSVATIYKRRLTDDEFAADEEQAIAIRREIRAEKCWRTIDKIADNEEQPKQFDAAKFQVERGEAPQAQRHEFICRIQHEAGLTIESLLPILARAKGLGPAPLGELPAAGEILAETFDSEPGPVRLPDTEQP